MKSKSIDITVVNKRAAVEGTPVIVCGNSDYVMSFSFDDEWGKDSYKTARFKYMKDGEWRHQDVIFSGATVEVPVLNDIVFVLVGVFEGDLCTTTPARVPCVPSILCGSGSKYEPTPEVYDQMMSVINNLVDRMESLESGEGYEELKDLRKGYDGQVYDTAGEAVRSQVRSLVVADEKMQGQLDGSVSEEPYTEWISGQIDGDTGELITDEVFNNSTDYISLATGSGIKLTECPEGGRLKVYGYTPDTYSYTRLLDTLSDPDTEAGLFTAEEDILVRCSDDGSGTFKINVVTVSAGLVERVDQLEAAKEDVEYHVGELDNQMSLVDAELVDLTGSQDTQQISEWVDGASVNADTGELEQPGSPYRTTELIELSAGSVLTTDGPEDSGVKVYSYDVTTQAYKGLCRTMGASAEYTVTEDMLVRCEDAGGNAVLSVTAVTAGRVDMIEKRLDALDAGIGSGFNLSKTITWDGNTDGRANIEALMWKVSDETISEDDLKNIEIDVVTTSNGTSETQTVSNDDVKITVVGEDEGLLSGATIIYNLNDIPLVMVTPTDMDVPIDEEGNTMHVEKGIYFLNTKSGTTMYVSRFEYDINKIEPKYINGDVLPSVTADDNGKMLQVVDGAWQAVTIANAEEGAY